MHVKEGVTGRYAVSFTDYDEISPEREFDGWSTTFCRDGRIDAGVRLTKIQLYPCSLPSLQFFETVWKGWAWIEWVEDAGEGGA